MLVLVVAAAVATNSIVVGVGDVDGARTTIATVSLAAVALPGPRADGDVTAVRDPQELAPASDRPGVRAVCSVEHGRGFVPAGVLIDDHRLALTVARASARDGSLVVVDLRTCAQRELLDAVVVGQAPLVVDGRLVVVRQIEPGVAGALFDVVAVDPQSDSVEVLASREALWVTAARGGRTLDEVRFLVGEGGAAGANDGVFHVDALGVASGVAGGVASGGLVVDVELGRGVFRSPVVLAGGGWLVEVDDGSSPAVGRAVGRAGLRDRTGKVLVRGLAGLSPVVAAAGGASWAAGSGRKDGSVVVDGVERASGRAGVARPLLLHDDVVIAQLDRGAALPIELWAIPPPASKASSAPSSLDQPRRLLPPRPRTAVVVYGATAAADSVGVPR